MLKAEHAGCLFLPPFNLSQNRLFKYLDFFSLKGPANKKRGCMEMYSLSLVISVWLLFLGCGFSVCTDLSLLEGI